MRRQYGLRGHEREGLEDTRIYIGKTCVICTSVPASQDQLIAAGHKTYYAFVARLWIPIKTNPGHPVVRVLSWGGFELECGVIVVRGENSLIQVTKILE